MTHSLTIVLIGNRTSDIVYFIKYSGDPGDKGPDYEMSAVVESHAGSCLSKINCLVSKEDCMNTLTTYDVFYSVRSQAKIDNKCFERIADPDPNKNYECFDDYCLFDIQHDPCEYRNVAKQNQQILNITIDMLEQFKMELIKQYYPDTDPNGNPNNFDGYWDTWMERNASSPKMNTNIMILLCFPLVYYIFIK